MYRLYEKVPKSEGNEFGLKLLEKSENPFKDGPCLVSMIAIVMYESDINGALNQGMEALRLKTNHNENSGIGLEDFQGKVLSVAYGEPSEESGIKGKQISNGNGRKESLDDEFTQKYLFPLIEDDGKKIDVLQAMRNMRNVNIMTYCGATYSVLRMEECLKNRMSELGYSEKEISQIQSQMCVISYATNLKLRRELVDKKKIESTHIQIGDVNDPDAKASQKIKEKAKTNGSIYLGEGYYFHYGSGEHSLKNYILENTALSTAISSVVTKALSNSISNSQSNEFIPLTKELFTGDIETIIEGIRQGKSKDELMSFIEEGIAYKDKPRDEKKNKSIIHPEYYRHSPISDLKSIMVNGLNPDKAKSNLRDYTSDERQKVFYSEGKEGAITFDCNTRSKFKQMQEQGKVPLEYTMDSYYKKVHDKGQDRVYLKIKGIELENEQNNNDDRYADACTSQTIPPENIFVCVLKNPKTGEITYRREDIIKYMMSQCTVQDIENKYTIDDKQKQKLVNHYNEMKDEIQKFSEYEMMEIGIEQFYQMVYTILPSEIGKATLDISTKSKDNAQERLQKDENQITQEGQKKSEEIE